MPIWYTLDEEENVIFNTRDKSVKAKNISRDNRVRLCVDDQVPLFSFVTIDGIAEIISNNPNEVFKWAKLIASRYVGQEKSELYGRRNSAGGELLIKIKPIRVIGQKDIAAGNPTNLKINLPIGKIIYGRINSSFLQRS